MEFAFSESQQARTKADRKRLDLDLEKLGYQKMAKFMDDDDHSKNDERDENTG